MGKMFSGSSSAEKTYLLKNTSSQSHIFTNTNLLKRTSSQTHILSNTHLGKHESSQTHIFSKTHLLAHGHWPLADGSHIGGVAAGVHPVGSPWAGTMCAGPTGARCLPAPNETKVFKPGLHHAPCGPIGTEGGRCEARALRRAAHASRPWSLEDHSPANDSKPRDARYRLARRLVH